MAETWDYEKNVPLTPDNVVSKSNKKVWWKCENGHSWQAYINSRTRLNSGCPYCAGQKVIKGKNDLVSKFPDVAEEWDYEKNGNLKPDMVMGAAHKKIWWKCTKGHSWQAPVSRRTSLGYGCPYCGGKFVIKGETDLASRFPDIALTWDYKKNGDLTPDKVTAFSTKKVWWLCPKYKHSYQNVVAYRTNMKSGCPYCSNNKVLKGFNDLQSANSHVASQWDYEKNAPITPDMVTRCSTRKFWWKCENGHSWQVDVDHRTRGHECPYCLGSKGERLLYLLLKKRQISYKGEYRIVDEYRIKYFPYDIYCDVERVLIEYDGVQHFEEKSFFTKEYSFKERIRRDNLKNDYAFKHMLPLLRIPYIYDADKDKEKIAKLLKYFIKTRKIPQEIIDFYKQYEFSNYAELASKWNTGT